MTTVDVWLCSGHDTFAATKRTTHFRRLLLAAHKEQPCALINIKERERHKGPSMTIHSSAISAGLQPVHHTELAWWTATRRADWTTKPCQSLSGGAQGKNCEIINWITKAESPQWQELDNCKIHNWLSQRWLSPVRCMLGFCCWSAACRPSCPSACPLDWMEEKKKLWYVCRIRICEIIGELIYFRHVWLTAVNLANQNK